MFPLHDENPTRSTPVVTITLVVLNAIVFVGQLLMGLNLSVYAYGLIPAELVHGADLVFGGRRLGLEPGLGVRNFDPAWATLFTSMFMHGGWLHIISNMWFLWLFGNNVEDSMGHGRFLLFYLAAGLAAAGAQIAIGTGSELPMVGASGAIGGVLGAYLVLFPGARIHTLVTLGFIITTMEVPALIVLGFWGLLQVISGLGTLGMERGGGVAYAAHVGGFLVGMLLGRLLGEVRRPASRRYIQRPDFMDWR